MITATIQMGRNGNRIPCDVLIDDEPDALGAIRIVKGNLRNTVKAIIVGNDEVFTDCIGPMFDGNQVFSGDPTFTMEVARVFKSAWNYTVPECFMAGQIPLHDRYETQAQYDLLSN